MLVPFAVLALFVLECSGLPKPRAEAAEKEIVPNAALSAALHAAGAPEDNYACTCHQIPGDDGRFHMRCHCKDKNNGTEPGGGGGGKDKLSGGAGGSEPASGAENGTESGGGGDDEDESCPYACPAGWTRFGFSENCYLLPAQPAKQDTFWNHQARCQATEKTSYVMVIDSILEQAAATPVALQYSLNWLGVLGNGFLWLGGYTDEKGNWQYLDGTDQSWSVLMAAANIIGSRKNFTCLGADIKTLGLWQTYPCSDKTGAAICEMPKRRVCGRKGGMLPISPVSMSPSQWMNLFPKLPSIPFVGQIFGESALDSALTSVGSFFTNLLGGDTKSKCPMGCPPGWIGAGFVGDHCYLIPKMPIKLDDYWSTQAYCQKTEPTSYLSIANGLMEQAIATAIAAYYVPNWIGLGTNAHLWMGGYTTDKGWKFLDGTDQTSNLLMTLANLITPAYKNGSCLSADIKTAGLWESRPCKEKTGTAFCEMPQRPVCGEQGNVFPFPIVDLSVDSLRNLFPKMPSIPFLGQILGEGSDWEDFFNPWKAKKNNETGAKEGDNTVHVMCAKPGTGLQAKWNSKPDWIWLYNGNEEVEVPGVWTQFKCKSGIVDAFRVKPSTYVSVLTRCMNQGYDTVMPANWIISGWSPFQVGKNLTQYYREDIGWLGKAMASYIREAEKPTKEC